MGLIKEKNLGWGDLYCFLDTDHIPEIIREFRLNSGFSVEFISQEIGLTQEEYLGHEEGVVIPCRETWKKFSSLVSIDPDCIFKFWTIAKY